MTEKRRLGLRLFGGYVEVTSSDLYRFHLRIGPVGIHVESKKLYQSIRESRARKGVER